MPDTYSLLGSTALVTGARGFIGSHLCRELSRQGMRVCAASRDSVREPNSSLHWFRVDLTDISSVKRLVAETKPDLVFHLASHVSGSRDRTAVRRTFDGNLRSTVNLLEAVAEIGCGRVILAGSLEEPFEDSATATPGSPYAAAKWASSAYGRMFHALYETPVAIARIFMVYGPQQRDLRKVVPYVALSLLRGESPRLGSGLRPVDWIYVEDVVHGLIAMAAAEGIEGETVDLGSGSLVTVRDFVQQLNDLIDSSTRPDFASVADRPLEQVRVANVADTFNSIGWRPTTSARQGLICTVDWCRELIASAVNV